MPEILKTSMSRIASLSIEIYGENELPNHGAPCSLTIHQGDIPNHVFDDCIKCLHTALNATPDDYPLRAPEIKLNARGSSYPNHRNNRTLTGGENYATITTIRREDAVNVFAKALRELWALNLISNKEYSEGERAIRAYDVSHSLNLMAHPDFKQGSLNIASYKVVGFGLPARSQEFLVVPMDTPPKASVPADNSLAYK